MDYRCVGLRIQQARQELGLTQQELASRLCMTQATLSNYEKGKRRLSLANLEQIADILGKSMSYFLDTLDSSDEDDDRRWYRSPYR